MLLEEFAVRKKKLRNEVPLEFRDVIYELAYEESREYGYKEIYYTMLNLIDSLKEPIEKFQKRIEQEILANLATETKKLNEDI